MKIILTSIICTLCLIACASNNRELKPELPCDDLRLNHKRIEQLEFKIDSLQNLKSDPDTRKQNDIIIETFQNEKRILLIANDRNTERCKPILAPKTIKEDERMFRREINNY